MPPVILAAPAIPGETAPLIELASRLVQADHSVTLLAGNEFAGRARDAGARFVALRGAADLTPEKVTQFFVERSSIPPGSRQLTFTFSRLLLEPMPDQYHQLQDLLREDPSSVLVANSAFLGMWPLALGAPGVHPSRWIAVGANPIMTASDDTTPVGPISRLPNRLRLLVHRLIARQMSRMLAPIDRSLADLSASLGSTRTPPSILDGIISLPDSYANLSIPEFDFPRADLPDTAHYMGLLTPTVPAGWKPPVWWAELDGHTPVIVVTQGTLANRDLTELIGPTLTALADEHVIVVAATGRTDHSLERRIPQNAHVVDHLPFAALLPKADLLITNGGFGGTQQALAAGCPVVVAGETEDKAFTAARVAFHGVGIDLGTQRPSVAQLRNAVRSLLADRATRHRVEEIAKAYARYDAFAILERDIAQAHINLPVL